MDNGPPPLTCDSVGRVTARLQPYLRRQNGCVTSAQATAAGLTPAQVRTLLAHGWTRPVRGVLVAPEPKDPFLTAVWVAALVMPDAVFADRTAVRLHDLWGLPPWTPAELPHVLLPAGSRRAQRSGLHSLYCSDPPESVRRRGFLVTSLGRTVADLACRLDPDSLVCLLDSALRRGWTLDAHPLSRRQRRSLESALRWADARSESALETRLRLLLIRAGLIPEDLQHLLLRPDGSIFARLDLAWPSRFVAVEADGKRYHSDPDPLFGDRTRQNRVSIRRWTVLRFTWYDVTARPEYVVECVRAALDSTQPDQFLR